MDIETRLRSEMVKYMVQKQIFCPVTGRVLDVRTVKYLVDRDGDPAYIMDPVAYDVIESDDKLIASLAEKGLFLNGEDY